MITSLVKKIILLNLIIFCNTISTLALPKYPAKEDSTERTIPIKKEDLLYIEILGNGGIFSINYERFITKNLSFRVGLGNDISPYASTPFTFYPIMINYTFELPFEIGVGIVPFSFGGKSRLTAEIFANKTKGTVITSLIGFKKTYGWFLFKASFTPFFNPVNSKFLLYGGLSIGYAF